MSDFDQIFGALQSAGVRYLVVGGVAVVLHGFPRFTADLDLILDMDPENVRAAVAVLSRLGYRPRAPVPAELLAESHVRRRWIEEKGLTVFSFWSPDHPATEVDIFVEEPLVFADAFARAAHAAIGDIDVTVASIADLIALKRRAGRPKDLEDISALEDIEDDGTD